MFVSGVCACANMDLNLLSESAMSQVFVKKMSQVEIGCTIFWTSISFLQSDALPVHKDA